MIFKKQFLKGVAVLGMGQLVGQFCSLGRNVIIARIVSPEDFGVAAIFVMVVSFLEMVSNFSVDRLLVQDNDGDNVRFQRVAQFLQASRGIVSAGLILLFAGFIARLFNIPEAKNAFYVLALVPLCTSFYHLDPKRIERKMQFWPGASVEMASQLLVLILAWPIGKWFGDYRAMLALLVVKQAVYMIGTQIVAQREYRWAIDKEYLRRFWHFGAPLLFNGVLMFLILQGDRFLMGSAKKIFGSNYDMGDVGMYSAAFMLTMIPAMMVSKVLSTLLLPILSKVREFNEDFIKETALFNTSVGIVGSLVCGLLLITGDKLLIFVYGIKYEDAGVLVSWLSVFWAIRMLRMIPAVVAMAKGHTKFLLFTNLLRSLALLGVLYVVVQGLPIIWIAIVGLVGEVVAYCYSLYLNKYFLDAPLRTYVVSGIQFLFCLIVAVVFKQIILSLGQGTSFLIVALVVVYVVQVLLLHRKFILSQLGSHSYLRVQ